jgi:hypothetical protein
MSSGYTRKIDAGSPILGLMSGLQFQVSVDYEQLADTAKMGFSRIIHSEIPPAPFAKGGNCNNYQEFFPLLQRGIEGDFNVSFMSNAKIMRINLCK